jgi:hypothetical protein
MSSAKLPMRASFVSGISAETAGFRVRTCASDVATVEAVPCVKIEVGGAQVTLDAAADASFGCSDFPFGLTPDTQLVTRPPNASFWLVALRLKVRLRKYNVDSVRSNISNG